MTDADPPSGPPIGKRRLYSSTIGTSRTILGAPTSTLWERSRRGTCAGPTVGCMGTGETDGRRAS